MWRKEETHTSVKKENIYELSLTESFNLLCENKIGTVITHSLVEH